MKLGCWTSIALVWIFSATPVSAETLQCAASETSEHRSGFLAENYVHGLDIQARIIIPGLLHVGDHLRLRHESSEPLGYEYFSGTVDSRLFPSAKLWINPEYMKNNGRFPGELILGDRRVELICLLR